MTENKKALKDKSLEPINIITQDKAGNKKDSFILFQSYQEIFDALDDAQAGKLIKGIFAYSKNGDVNLDASLSIIFIPIRQQLDRNAEKYRNTVIQRRLAGSKGGKQRVANQANATFTKQNQANQADNDNVYVYDNDINNINNKNNIIDISENKKFKKPTLIEVQNYISEIGSNVDVNQFMDFYSANGWKVGKNPMKDWKATLRGWDRRNNKSTNSNKQEGEEYVYNPYLWTKI